MRYFLVSSKYLHSYGSVISAKDEIAQLYELSPYYTEVELKEKPKPRSRVLYYNLVIQGESLTACSAHPSREDADKAATPSRVGCKRVEFIEGQYDD